MQWCEGGKLNWNEQRWKQHLILFSFPPFSGVFLAKIDWPLALRFPGVVGRCSLSLCYFSFLGHFFFAVYGVQVSGGCSIASGAGMFETCESMARPSFVSLAHLAVACSQHELQTACAACPSFQTCVSRHRKTYTISFIMSIAK